ncbi:MAG: hypothetical protein ACJ77K_15210 [Bacteroidia bacterium]
MKKLLIIISILTTVCLSEGLCFAQELFPPTNTEIRRLNEYEIDARIRENKTYATSNHIEYIYMYNYDSQHPGDSTLQLLEHYDKEGRILVRNKRSGNYQYQVEYLYDKKGRMNEFIEKYSNYSDLTKLHYDENDRIDTLERVYSDGHSYYFRYSYYPNGKLKSCNSDSYYYDNDWKLTCVVNSYKPGTPDTTMTYEYNESGCLISVYEKNFHQEWIKQDSNCRPLETYSLYFGRKDRYQKTPRDFEQKNTYEYNGERLITHTHYNFIKKKKPGAEREVKDSWTNITSYYENGLIKTSDDKKYYYKFYEQK